MKVQEKQLFLNQKKNHLWEMFLSSCYYLIKNRTKTDSSNLFKNSKKIYWGRKYEKVSSFMMMSEKQTKPVNDFRFCSFPKSQARICDKFGFYRIVSVKIMSNELSHIPGVNESIG